MDPAAEWHACRPDASRAESHARLSSKFDAASILAIVRDGELSSARLCRKLLCLSHYDLTLVVARPANAIRSTEGTAMARSPPARVRRITNGPVPRRLGLADKHGGDST
jgi:hypothetical protein